ncbi:hypothetical protein SCHPADRAFT_625814 [Schizopora paradoxa]|uniref:Uncharacterized protein n=1 Tax=Schizopora paradoxa TaxID=27342 RepID=A0A0H2R844_9AGAM|nr:hypothetical protein SCHPADRAFT_625814 [Schizopora paradoxa]
MEPRRGSSRCADRRRQGPQLRALFTDVHPPAARRERHEVHPVIVFLKAVCFRQGSHQMSVRRQRSKRRDGPKARRKRTDGYTYIAEGAFHVCWVVTFAAILQTGRGKKMDLK